MNVRTNHYIAAGFVFILTVFFIGLVLSICHVLDASTQYMLTAEFARQERIWMPGMNDRYLGGDWNDQVIFSLVGALEPHVPVTLLVRRDSDAYNIRSAFSRNDVPHSHVTFKTVPALAGWIRDYGPCFLRNSDHGMAVADFRYDFSGAYPVDSERARAVGSIDSLIAVGLGMEVRQSLLINEGGARETNGKGTLLVVEEVEMMRHQDLSRQEIEDELCRVLGQKKVIWLKQGLAEDRKMTDGALPGNIFPAANTGGHIDNFCRFVTPDTILLAEVLPEDRDTDPVYAMSHQRLEENLAILEAATDQDGKPFTIIRVPVATHLYGTYTVRKGDIFLEPGHELRYEDGSPVHAWEEITYLLTTSYLNFLVTNGAVLVPQYWKPGRSESIRRKDELAQAALADVFPGRDIIPIDAEPLNHGGGGIHCFTMQQPSKN